KNKFRKDRFDLTYNPENYFIYNKIKIISLNNLINFKKNRNYSKDGKDILLLEQMKSKENYFITFKLKLYFLLLRIILKFIDITPKKIKDILRKNNFINSIYKRLF